MQRQNAAEGPSPHAGTVVFLTIADLAERPAGAVLPDLVLAERLGFADRHMIRRLIERHRAELETYGALPGIMVGVRVWRDGTEERHTLDLDGVHFDFRDGRDLALLTWRARFPMPEMRGISLVLAERARVRTEPRHLVPEEA